jgi:leucyl-tRNA synthetase
MSLNTAIAALMELTNELFRLKAADAYGAAEWRTALCIVVQMLAPFAPHIAEELWHHLGNDTSVHAGGWPPHDPQYLIEDTRTVVVQVNGKLRGDIQVANGADEQTVIEAAKADTRVAAHLEGKSIRKTIYVPERLVNFVV